MTRTLRELMAKHPEWADLPIVVSDSEAEYHYIGASGDVYDSIDEGEDPPIKVLVFTGN